MKKIYNNISFCIVWILGAILGIMPRFVWLIMADVLYVILYKGLRYRVKVTRENLRLSFPEKSATERKWIERKSKSKLLPVYHPLASAWADKLFLNMRKRFGAEPVSMKMIGRKLIDKKDEKIILALIADQTPPRFEKTKWVTFLNQDTMFFGGIETISRKYKMPIYFFDIDSTKRGYYKGKFVLLHDGKEDLDQHEITQRYIDYLECKIRNKPEFWMWSHKRWKHKKH